MSWFKKLLPSRIRTGTDNKKGVPEGLWSKCDNCNSVLYRSELERNLEVCPKCDYHIRIPARRRIDYFLDAESGVEIGADVGPSDPLKFRDIKKYKDRLSTAQKDTGEKEALVAMHGKLCGMNVVVTAFEYGFIGGSMGAAVGERFARAVNTCIELRAPLICFSASGGGAHAGSINFVDANGQGECCTCTIIRAIHSLCFCADGPDYGRSVCKSCHVR